MPRMQKIKELIKQFLCITFGHKLSFACLCGIGLFHVLLPKFDVFACIVLTEKEVVLFSETRLFCILFLKFQLHAKTANATRHKNTVVLQ